MKLLSLKMGKSSRFTHKRNYSREIIEQYHSNPNDYRTSGQTLPPKPTIIESEYEAA